MAQNESCQEKINTLDEKVFESKGNRKLSRTLSVIRDCPQSYIAQILCNIMCDK